PHSYSSLFFFNHPPTTGTYTLSLHDALPISCTWTRRTRTSAASGSSSSTSPVLTRPRHSVPVTTVPKPSTVNTRSIGSRIASARSEEHTSELQSRGHLVCRLLLEKKK